MQIISFLNKYVFGIGVPVFLIALGMFFCVRLRFFHILHPIKTLKCLFEKNDNDGVSSAKALTLALAGTLGVGNMVGVASAIALGGYGAIFWMWISALVAMLLKYAEIVLAMKHRSFDSSGKPYGSAMLYIKECFKNGRFARSIAAIFAFLCVLNSISMGSMIQVNSAASAMSGVFKIPPIITGALLSAVSFFAIKKGASGVLGFTEKLVPFMTVGFVVLSLGVICSQPTRAINAIELIFEYAISFRSASGGIVGFLTSRALRYGTMRGILSNEAGCGTAPAAHAVSDCKTPAKQGVWGIFEVFVDTVLLCTLTAIVIIMGNDAVKSCGENYMMMTVEAYGYALGDFARYFIALSVLLFGFATILCWGYYGLSSVRYLCSNKRAGEFFLFVYALSVVLGAVVSSDIIWESADFAIGAMTLINLTVLLIMNREVKDETDAYFKRKK